jgi:fructoselysine-6-P-deglycase FrlB-like protein
MSEIDREIASQPEAWRRAAEAAPAASAALPRPDEDVAALGCGTSLFIAQAYAARREERGLGRTDAFPASEFPAHRAYDRIVAISRSGTTTEVVRALEAIRDAVPSTVITAVDGTPATDAARETVAVPFADERSVVQTRFATTALALLRVHLGEDVEPAAADAESALKGEPPVDASPFRQIVFLGRGWTVGLANEAALKFREAAGAWSESYPGMEYRHGPMSVADSRSLVWSLGALDGSVLDDAGATGATIVNGGDDPMAELVRVHRSAVALARSRGLDPDHPPHLTRSVVLS